MPKTFQAMLAKFELQWESGTTPNVNDLIAEFGPLAPQELAHLLLVDLSYRSSRELLKLQRSTLSSSPSS